MGHPYSICFILWRQLLKALQIFKDKPLELDNFLVQWRIELQHELDSNSGSGGMLR